MKSSFADSARWVLLLAALGSGCTSFSPGQADLGAGEGAASSEASVGDRGAALDGSLVSCTFSYASAAGADGVWGTADDLITAGQTASYSRSGQMTGYLWLKPGADGTIGTSDDVVDHLLAFSYDAAGRRVGARTFGGPGGDGRWGTADDLQRQREAYTFDAQSHCTDRTIFFAVGPDGLWGTADDAIGSRHAYAGFVPFLKETAATKAVLYSEAGADGKWFTADDKVQMAERRVIEDRAVAGWSLEANISLAPGQDSEWATVDDPIHQRVVWQCVAKVRTMIVYRAPGPDGQWGTTDDEVLSRAQMISNAGCPFSFCDVTID